MNICPFNLCARRERRPKAAVGDGLFGKIETYYRPSWLPEGTEMRVVMQDDTCEYFTSDAEIRPTVCTNNVF